MHGILIIVVTPYYVFTSDEPGRLWFFIDLLQNEIRTANLLRLEAVKRVSWKIGIAT